MSQISPDKELELRINTDEKADIYLSCSWRPDLGQDVSWLIVKELDQSRVRAVGDVADLPKQDDNRIRRIMQKCDGFLVVLPYRKEAKSTTSSNIIREVRIAAALGLPIGFFVESRVDVVIENLNDEIQIRFSSNPSENPIIVRQKNFFGPFKYDAEDRAQLQNQVTGKLHDYISLITQQNETIKPYAFLATRLKSDFKQARDSIRIAVENTTGIPCIWSDDKRHTTNVQGIRERTRLLIKYSEFLIADLSFSTSNAENDNPSRAHEIGMAIAYQHPIILSSQGPRRRPYFSANDIQMVNWENEGELNMEISNQLLINQEQLGRRIYNWELSDRDNSYTALILKKKFVYDKSHRYIAPNVYPLSPIESWIIALGFGLIALSTSLLVNLLLGFTDTFGFAAIIASIFAMLFSSDINKSIRQALGQSQFLRWFIPTAGLLLLILWLVLKSQRAG